MKRAFAMLLALAAMLTPALAEEEPALEGLLAEGETYQVLGQEGEYLKVQVDEDLVGSALVVAPHPEDARNPRRHRLAGRGLGHFAQPHAVGEPVHCLRRGPQSQPSLSDPSHPAQGDDPVDPQQTEDGIEVAGTADETVEFQGKVLLHLRRMRCQGLR